MTKTEGIFKKAVRQSMVNNNRTSFDNIRIGTVVDISSGGKYLTVRILKSGEIIRNVTVPVGGIQLAVNDTVAILCPDIRNRSQNFVLASYGGGVPFINAQNRTITNPTITNASIVSSSILSSTITNPNIVGASITGGSWLTFTPTWTGISLYNATNTGKYSVIGKDVSFVVSVTFGTSTSMGSNITLSLPVTKHSTYPASAPIGQARFFESGANIYPGQILGSGLLSIMNTSGTYATEAFTSATIPFTWGNADALWASGTYEAA